MSERPFEEKDVLWRWRPTTGVRYGSTRIDEYAFVQEGSRVRMYFHSKTWMKDYYLPAWGADLLRQLRESQGRHRELLDAAREYAIATGGIRDEGCPADDTCDCRFRPLMDRLERSLSQNK